MNSTWNSIYSAECIPKEHSSLATFILRYVTNFNNIIDVGCGNGRDAIFFSDVFDNVLAFDESEVIINKNKESNKRNNLQFHHKSVGEILSLTQQIDNIYIRFLLHAINKEDSIQLLYNCYKMLVYDSGRLFIECRSVKDSIYEMGTPGKERDEFIYGHYRRFIRLDELIALLQKIGFAIMYKYEGNDLSVWGDSNPTLIRIICKKESHYPDV